MKLRVRPVLAAKLQWCRIQVPRMDMVRALNRSQSCFMTDGQSVSMYWCRAPLWDPCPDFTFSFLLPENCLALRLGAPSPTRGRVCNL
jgi:hypothetical protein